MLPWKAWRFIGLNVVRALSLIALILVFVSNILVMVHDVRTAPPPHPSRQTSANNVRPISRSMPLGHRARMSMLTLRLVQTPLMPTTNQSTAIISSASFIMSAGHRLLTLPLAKQGLYCPQYPCWTLLGGPQSYPHPHPSHPSHF